MVYMFIYAPSQEYLFVYDHNMFTCIDYVSIVAPCCTIGNIILFCPTIDFPSLHIVQYI